MYHVSFARANYISDLVENFPKLHNELLEMKCAIHVKRKKKPQKTNKI